MSFTSKCHKEGCKKQKHFCISCGIPEEELDLYPKYQGYCSWECYISQEGIDGIRKFVKDYDDYKKSFNDEEF